MLFFHRVKQKHRHLGQRFNMRRIAHVTSRETFRCRDNILVKIMRGLIDTVLLRVVAGDSIADDHTRRPQLFCAQSLCHTLTDNNIGHDQRIILVGESQFLRDLLQALFAELFHVVDELLDGHRILVAVLLEAAYQFRNILP